MKKWLIYAALIWLFVTPSSAFIRYGTGISASDWHDLQIGGGGFNTGISVASDGTKVIRTDTYGGYVLNGSTWQQLLTTVTMPSSAVPPTTNANQTGLYEVEVCKAASSVIYIIPGDGFLYRSANKGSSFTKTNMTQLTVDPNAGTRIGGRFMACDPADTTGNNLIVGGTAVKPRYTTDGGSTFTTLSTLATPSASQNSMIAYDPTTSSGGATPGVFICVYGTGIYHTSTGPSGTWTLTTSTPTTCSHLIVDAGGKAWLIDDAAGGVSGNVSHLTTPGGTWANNNTAFPSGGYHAIAVDPANTNHVVVASTGTFLSISTDGGVLLANNNTTAWGTGSMSGDQTWFNQSWSGGSPPFFTSGDITFDPSQSSRLYAAWGFGTFFVNPYASGTSVALTTIVTGIEQLVAQSIMASPSGDIVVGSEDVPVFHQSSSTLNSNATAQLPGYVTSVGNLANGYSFDYASNNTSFIVGIITGGPFYNCFSDFSGFSSNGGASWTKFTTIPAGAGGGSAACGSGNIAVIDTTHFVWMPGGTSTSVYFTANAGSSWSAATGLSGTFVNSTLNVSSQYVASDKQAIGTVWAYLPGNAGNASPGVYKSTNNGSTWSNVIAGALDAARDGGGIFKVDPNNSDLYYTPAASGAGSFFQSTNHTSFSAISNMVGVTAFGFGAKVPGQAWSYLGAVGTYNGVYGIWQSIDRGATFTQVGTTYPNGWFKPVNSMDGDKSIAGQWYISLDGAGFKYFH